jgi:hypothetical protein
LVEFCVEVDGPQEILELTDLNNFDCFRRTVVSIPPRVTGVVRNDGQDNFDRLTSLAFQFDANVSASLNIADLRIVNAVTGSAIDLSQLDPRALAWNAVTQTARWDLLNLGIPHAYYEISLDARSIRDELGVLLDGNGDGVPGDDYVQTLLVALPGDANLSGCVDGTDFSLWNANKFTSGGVTWQQGDFNNDDVVDGSDFSLWNAYKFTCVASSSRPTPTATPTHLAPAQEESRPSAWFKARRGPPGARVGGCVHRLISRLSSSRTYGDVHDRSDGCG